MYLQPHLEGIRIAAILFVLGSITAGILIYSAIITDHQEENEINKVSLDITDRSIQINGQTGYTNWKFLRGV